MHCVGHHRFLHVYPGCHPEDLFCCREEESFSTCTSHLTAVTIFYGTLSYMYLHHCATESQEQEKMASVFYGVMIPMLTPLIYSLRNQDVREALKGVGKKCF